MLTNPGRSINEIVQRSKFGVRLSLSTVVRLKTQAGRLNYSLDGLAERLLTYELGLLESKGDIAFASILDRHAQVCAR